MPLFDLNNLEHTSCNNDGCGIPYGNTMIVYIAEEKIPVKSAISEPETVISKLTRNDFKSETTN